MAAAAFFGHFFLGIGPGVAFFLIIIAPKSFVVLLSLFSAFFWLMVLLITTALFRGFVPIPSSQASYTGALVAAVAMEEAARIGVWQMHKRALVVLHRMSQATGHSFTKLDELYLALGWGYGHAAVHILFLFASLLPLTAGHGTAYSVQCPQMSIFLVGALNSLGMGATLVALSVIALDGWSRGSWVGKSYAPLMHAGAALLTLGSFRPGGCTAAVATQLALGLVNTWYAASIAWKQGGSSSGRNSGPSGVPVVGAGQQLVAAADSAGWMAADGSAGGAGRASSSGVMQEAAAVISPRSLPASAGLRSRAS